MLLKGTIASQLSGSLAGLTASHNRGGQYLRARTIPTDPMSSRQAQIRELMTNLNDAWQGTLTQAERDGWDNYAVNTPLLNALGSPVNVGGKGMYIRGNLARLYATAFLGATLTQVDTPPATMGLPSAAGLTIGDLDASADTVEIAYTDGEAWASAPQSALLVYTSNILPSATQFYKGPYQLSYVLQGNAVPPASPAAATLQVPVAVGQRIGVRVVLVTADGRQSADLRELRTAVA